jgi:DNA-binding NarL/FixJ family response regulator
MSIRVLLADDHQVLRVGITTLISQERDIDIVGEAADGATAVELARRLQPDVVLMDIEMPGLNGVEATRRIVREMPGVKVVMLTMYQEENQGLEALRVGAMGYLCKTAKRDELLDTIRTAAAGEAVLSRSLATRVLAILRSPVEHDQARAEPAGVELTEREIILLRAVAQGLTNKQIADQVSLSESRVRNLLSEIYRKLQVAGRVQAATYAIEKGLA